MGRWGSGLFRRLYHRKWLMPFSLKLQRDNRKNALTADPAKGETEKKLYFSQHCGDETTTYSNRAFPKGSAIACCFIPTTFGRLRQRWHCTADPAMSGSEMGGLLHNMVKVGLFLFSDGEPHGRDNLFFGGQKPDKRPAQRGWIGEQALLTRLVDEGPAQCGCRTALWLSYCDFKKNINRLLWRHLLEKAPAPSRSVGPDCARDSLLQ